MSKVDAMRALREARYAAAAKAGPAAAPRPSTQARPAPRRTPAAAAAEEAEAAPALCGHRNMSGRSCTRGADHVQEGTRNHRYG